MNLRERRYSRISATIVSFVCCLRGIPFLVAAMPRTPLRVLCMVAFDTIHVLRTSKPLPRERLLVLAAFLDFAACSNAVLDDKRYCENEKDAALKLLLNAGLGPLISRYISQLRGLENQRPSVVGDQCRFEEVRRYRESIARFSLEIISQIASKSVSNGQVDLPYHSDDGLEILFRIVMHCQIIDDILDYAQDASAGLPSFVTATSSLSEAFELTAKATRQYGFAGDLSKSKALFPLRMALHCVSTLTKLVIHIRFWNIAAGGTKAVDVMEQSSRPVV